MKLKTVVASLVTLGFSGPVLAVSQPYIIDTSYQMEVMRDQANKLDMLLDRNQPGGFDQPCGWTCRINLSGWMNIDAYFANTPSVFYGVKQIIAPSVNPDNRPQVADGLYTTKNRSSDLVLNNANLFVDARVNNWVTANLSLMHSASFADANVINRFYHSPFVYHPLSRTALDTAYATIGNMQVSPFYFRVGKQYLPFGAYDPYGFVTQDNPTTLLTETTAPAAQLGFVLPNGLYGSAYTFAGHSRFSTEPFLQDSGPALPVIDSNRRRIQNGGGDLGWGWRNGCSKFNLNVGYLANIADSNFLSSYYLNPLFQSAIINYNNPIIPALPFDKVPAYTINADVAYGPFDVNAHYVTTTKNLETTLYTAFSVDTSQIDPEDAAEVLNELAPFNFTKPKAWGVELGVTFPVVAHQSRLALGYQQTHHLAGLLPKNRYYVDYMVNLAKWFDLGVAVFQNRDYPFGERRLQNTDPDDRMTLIPIPGGTGHKSTTGQLRASIKFA